MQVYNFYSHAKLLLTGEYLVLLGARALALPLRFGQTLAVENTDKNGILQWKAMEYEVVWFSASLQISDLSVIETTDIQISNRLVELLKVARRLNPLFLSNSKGFMATTNLNFSREWGLGTSSTLISNIAWWAGVDPYALHWEMSDGSGYDIACSREIQPLIYHIENQKPFVQLISFNPPFKENVYFVYLGKKQDSATSIKGIERNIERYQNEIKRMSEITELFATVTIVPTAISLIEEHEQIISQVMGQTPIGKALFADFSGGIKSLGAWGGDFIMVISEAPKQQVYAYFQQKGLSTIFSYAEMVK